jgi:hypothetical protein
MKAKVKGPQFPKWTIPFAVIGILCFAWFVYSVTQNNIGWAIFALFWSSLAISQIATEVELNENRVGGS